MIKAHRAQRPKSYVKDGLTFLVLWKVENGYQNKIYEQIGLRI